MEGVTLFGLAPTSRYLWAAKPGRNAPCWCGSGKRYKKCHDPELPADSCIQTRSSPCVRRQRRAVVSAVGRWVGGRRENWAPRGFTGHAVDGKRMWWRDQGGLRVSRSRLHLYGVELHLPDGRELHLVGGWRRWRWLRPERLALLPQPEHVQRLLPGLVQCELQGRQHLHPDDG
ncbi:MAG: SEC-C domain-containing protein [Deltaproteobacteria bacterium]|nr:SEC-C domain-containing protein [Deltaproteobacteria bacterium]